MKLIHYELRRAVKEALKEVIECRHKKGGKGGKLN